MHDVLERIDVPHALEEVPILGSVYRVEPGDVRDALEALARAREPFDFLVDLFGIDTGEGVDAVYRLRSLARAEDVVIKAGHPYGGLLHSVWTVHKAALMPERELCELFDLRLEGHPNPKRLLTTDGCDPYLLKEIPIRTADEVRDRAAFKVDSSQLARSAGSVAARVGAAGELSSRPRGIRRIDGAEDSVRTEHLIVNMGPQHPSTHGVLRLVLEVDGEEVVAGEAVVGQLHRGIEKLAESRAYAALGTLMDRGDYVSGIHGELAAALAAEKLMQIEPAPRAQWIRCLVGEINRIASHLVWFGPNTLDAGVMGLFLYLFKDREDLVDILEDICGQRMMFNYIRPGGVLNDITSTCEKKIRAFLRSFSTRIDEHEEFVMGNELFLSRVEDIGVIERDEAVSFGLTGANLRASGVSWDVRKDAPYAAYDRLDFEVPTAAKGDIKARFEVRIAEMRQSLRMIEQCIDGLPEGDPTSEVPKKAKPPAGEAYAAVESPRGELGVHLVSDGGPTPYRMRYRPPALYALQAGEAMLPGLLIADTVVALGSLDFILGEIDR